MEYKKTVNLPRTKFPMRANLPNKEPQMLNKWNKQDYYGKVRKLSEGRPKYMLHDGPPYANGDIHLGTALNKILKDFIVRYKTMTGYDAPYVPGWDCHGLPIEHKVMNDVGQEKARSMPKVEFRERCRKFARKYIKRQRKSFKRLGVWGKWEDPYITMSRVYESKIVEAFAKFVEQGMVYKGLKPVHWCASCQTALAEAEVEYYEHTSPSIYVDFPVIGEDFSLIIWTTTPWTLPANVAVTVHPDFDYCFVKHDGKTYVIAEGLVEHSTEEMGWEDYEIVKKVKGTELEGLKCKHPFDMCESLVILGTHVTLEAGTGCVHTAPGHGAEDFVIGQKYDLPVVNPVDNKGQFTDQVPEFEGMHVHEANPKIVEKLREDGTLLHAANVGHSYPHCWRCKNPIIFRATEQWFVEVDKNNWREKALKEIETVRWIPKWGEERIHLMVEQRPDWCLSRQRIWGVPIPAVICDDCGEVTIDHRVAYKFAELSLEEGNDCWFKRDVEDFLPEGFACPKCNSTNFKQEEDILDVWFDSGVSHYAVLTTRDELTWPADLYLEGQDQYRGWFQSSLWGGLGVKGKSPYKIVITHGFTVDEEGRKMSKSLGNFVDPNEVMKEYGADILRLWVSSEDYRGDMSLSANILKRTADAYRRIRNTARFLLGNLKDFDPRENRVDYENMSEIDRWALARLQWLIDRVHEAYDNFEFHRIFHSVHTFCAVDLSSFYLDILKDRMYCDAADSITRRSSQTVMYEILLALTKLLAPVLVFTAEEIWSRIPNLDDDTETVHFTQMPQANTDWWDKDLLEKWEELENVRDEVLKPLEIARQEKKMIGSGLEASVELYVGNEGLRKLLEEQDLPTFFIVSQVKLVEDESELSGDPFVSELIPDLKVVVKKAEHDKCERCWNYRDSVGTHEDHPTLCDRCVEVVSAL